MKESQYINDYLRCNAQRGYNKGLTVQTYLHYWLSGKAKSYSHGYATALHNAIKRRMAAGEVIEGPSAMHATAFYPMPFDKYDAKWHDVIRTIGRILTTRKARSAIQRRAIQLYGDDGAWISGGFRESWPEDIKHDIRSINQRINKCLHEMEMQRPHRAHESKMWRIYRDLVQQFIYRD